MNRHAIEQKAISKQRELVKVLHTYGMDVNTWETLLNVASNSGKASIDLVPRSGVSKSAISRHVQYLSGAVFKMFQQEEVESGNLWDMVDNPLIEVVTDPLDSRRRSLYLTKHGADFLGKVDRILTV